MAEEEGFVSRWSRLKRETAAASAPAAAPPPAPLPAVESLEFESDFTGFLHAKVDEKLKQAALKKLFHSPQFNVMDGLDVYIDDYNTFEPISEEMLRRLNHAKDLLFREDPSQADACAARDAASSVQTSDEPPSECAAIAADETTRSGEATAQQAVANPESDNPR